MIYTLGDSFTKWHWPTWSDWLSVYQDQPVTNWAYPGNTNELIYYTLLEHVDQLTPTDTVYIMWTGNNRVCEWYDITHVQTQDISGFFPDTQGKLWCGAESEYQGFYKTHPDRMPSLTHMVISNFEIMLRTQWLLKSVGCDYHMMFWQNPWSDTRESFKPTYLASWYLKPGSLSDTDQQQAKQIMNMPVVRKLLGTIDWSKYYMAPTDLKCPDQYQGLWEFLLSDPELVLLNHDTDHHPNTLSHHDWVVDVMLPGTAPVHRDSAIQQAHATRHLDLPVTDYRKQSILNRFGELTDIKS